MTLAVRHATADDIPVIAMLCASVQHRHASVLPHRFKQAPLDSLISWLDVHFDSPQTKLWVATTDEGLIGYLLASIHERDEDEFAYARRSVFIDQLAVDEPHRRVGAARALVDTLVEHAISIGAEDVELNSWLFNDDAREAFVHLRFTQIGQFKKLEQRAIPHAFDYKSVPGFSREVLEKFVRVRPSTIGQASRISGVTPASISLLIVALEKFKRNGPRPDRVSSIDS